MGPAVRRGDRRPWPQRASAVSRTPAAARLDAVRGRLGAFDEAKAGSGIRQDAGSRSPVSSPVKAGGAPGLGLAKAIAHRGKKWPKNPATCALSTDKNRQPRVGSSATGSLLTRVQPG